MTVVCDYVQRTDLIQTLSLAGRVVPRRAIREVLTCVSLAPGRLEATDGEIRLEVPIVYGGDSLLLPFARLDALARACTGEQVVIEPEDGQATIRASRGVWRLPTRSPEEWPEMAPAEWSPVARIPADQLARGIAAVIDACDRDSSRYALSAVLIEVIDGVVHLVATDGRRLHLHRIEIDQAVDDCSVLLTERSAQLVAHLASQLDDEGEVQIERSGAEVLCSLGAGGPESKIYARTVDGKFPAWQKVIPTEGRATPTTVRADRLCEAIRQASICTSETTKAVTLTLGQTIIVEATSSEAGNARVELEPIEAGDEVTIQVDPSYCVAFLRRVDAVEPVEVEAVDASSALVFRTEDSVGVVMPMGVD